MKINNTAAKHIKKYCYIVGLLSFLIAFFACSQISGKGKKSIGNLYGTKYDKESQGKAGQLYNDF